MKEVLAERMKSLRANFGLSQAELSEKADVPQSAISEAENEARMLRGDTLFKIAAALNTSTSYLLGETNEVSRWTLKK